MGIVCKILLIFLPTGIVANDPAFEVGSLGAVFTPYSKFHTDKTDYPLVEIETMLELVCKRFPNITTYGMGTRSPTSKWNESNAAEGRAAFAAARVNQNLEDQAITLDIGVWLDPNNIEITKQEIVNAFDAAIEANKIFKGTVSGIIMGTQWDDSQLDGTLRSLTETRDRAKRLSLDIGIRSTVCGRLSSGAIQKTLNSIIFDIVKKLDFVICHLLPVGKGPHTNITEAVNVLGKSFLEWREDFRKTNPRIRVSAQTGWPSEGTIGGIPGTVETFKQFWLQMVSWSKSNDFRVDIFTAFDEYWKTTERDSMEAEGHFGWWMRIKNDSNGPDAFAEKIYYTKPAGESDGLKIGLGLLGAVIVLALFLSIAYLYMRLRTVQTQLLTKAEIEEFENGMLNTHTAGLTEDALRLPYDRSYELSKAKFIIDTTKLLGSGAFGTVYKGKLDGNPNDVAFKMTQSNCSSNNLKSLLSEIKIMIHVGKHLNVVSIIGAYTGEMRQGLIMIAIELCDGGSLEKHLRANKYSFLSFSPANETVRYENDPTSTNRTTIQLEDLIKWSYHIACGMEHIASKNVIHADLAIRNVLLTSDGTAKITDFGLSRRLYEYTNYVKSNQEPLPWRWMAIESLQHMTFSTKSDVWSYGITLWEIFSLGNTPYPGLAWTVDFTQDLQQGLRMSKPQYASLKIYTKMGECWKDDPDKRPDFTDLKLFFLEVLQEITTLEYANLLKVYDGTVTANRMKSSSDQVDY